jgi:hypothetical protein
MSKTRPADDASLARAASSITAGRRAGANARWGERGAARNGLRKPRVQRERARACVRLGRRMDCLVLAVRSAVGGGSGGG